MRLFLKLALLLIPMCMEYALSIQRAPGEASCRLRPIISYTELQNKYHTQLQFPKYCYIYKLLSIVPTGIPTSRNTSCMVRLDLWRSAMCYEMGDGERLGY